MLGVFTCSQGEKDEIGAHNEEGIFVRYSEVSKANKIYIPSLRKVVTRRDVKFKEYRAFRRSHGSDVEVREQEALKIEVTPAPTTTMGQSSDEDKEEQQQQVQQ